MKWYLSLGLLACLLISCGERHGADIYGNGDYRYQKPDDDGGWSTLTSATVLDDHQIYFRVDRNNTDGNATSYEVFVDEKTLTMKAFVGDLNIIFGTITCSQTGANQCIAYEITSYFGTKFRVKRRPNTLVKIKNATGDRQVSYPSAYLQQIERNHNWDYFVIQQPNEPVVHWLAGSFWLPDFVAPLMSLGMGLVGPLKESAVLYKFESMSYQYFSDRTEVKGSFRHIISGQVEVITWELRSDI
jgi:hypothetical protein